ncbi:hypothetical protein Goarm_020499, partial [Gossypium armourianum]|nr:hypothetical protein [Gossypium armourianum]
MLENFLPHAMLKAKPNLELRIRTLKKDWATVYDMLSGKENNNFSWDEHRQMVVAEDAVRNSYITDQFRHRSFPYYDQLTSIYAKDRATEKDAQIAADIVEEIDVEDVTTTNNIEEGNNYHECKNDVSLDEMNVFATQLQSLKPNQDGSTFSKKKKKIS